MKNKLQKTLLCLLAVILLLTGAMPVFAEDAARTVNEAQGFIDGIIANHQNQAGVTSIQGWINGTLTKNAGTSSEWYAISLSQYGNYDFSSYQEALLNYLDNNDVAGATSRQKYALALIGCGSADTYIYSVLNNSIGEQGVMSWIFGLHLLNNGYTSNEYSISAVKQKLLSLQHTDGGWSITGSNSDVDVTAMVVQALAPYYKTDLSVKSAADKALELLSARQKENGDFASYGVNNPESTAQVLTALSALGIDCETDSRFIKNGNTLFDGISLYRLSDGTFCHKQGGTSNGNATVQVFYSMVSYIRMKNGQASLYLLDARNPSGLIIPTEQTSKPENTQNSSQTSKPDNTQNSSLNSSSTATDSNNGQSSTANNQASTLKPALTTQPPQTSAPSSQTDNKSQNGATDASKDNDISDDSAGDTENEQTFTKETSESKDTSQTVADDTASSAEEKADSVSYKVWACFAIIIIAGGICIVLFCCKKKNIRNFIVIEIAAAASVIFVLITNFQSADNYYNQSGTDKSNSIGTVTITIRCDTVPDKSAEHIPDDGIILDVSTFEIEEGDTVYDVLSEAAAKNKIHLETSGSADSAYVEGISNIYEFDFGDLSGWMYFVNGESPSVSCGEYVLSDDDEIRWLYTCDIGKDLENIDKG